MDDLSFLEATPEMDLNTANEVGRMLGILKAKRQAIAYEEEKLKLLKADERQLITVGIPQVFKKHGISDLGMEDGTRVTISEELSCALIKDEERRKQAFAWLIDNGGEDLIHDLLTIESPSIALLEVLNKGGVVYSMSRDVNTNSLKAWFREKLGMKEGIIATLTKEEVPKEFGLFIEDLAKIKEPKGRG